MPSKKKQLRKQFIWPDSLAKAVAAHAKKTKRSESELVRTAIANYIGKPELAEMRGKGRPKNQE